MKLQKIFGFATVVLILSGMFIGLIQFPQLVRANGESWLNGWGYRKSLIVNNGVHVITVHFGVGNDVLGHTYISGNCQPDFDDIRFTSSDGETLVADVTVRTKVDGNHAEFKVNVINSPIYVYYGEASASGVYTNEVFGSGSIGDTAVLTQHYNITSTANKTITGIVRVSPVTGFVTSLEAEISSFFGSTAKMALLLMNVGVEEIDGVYVEGKRIVAVTETKSISVSDKHREVFTFDRPVPIFKGTKYGITLWGSINTTIWYESGVTASSFRFTGDLSGDMIRYTQALDTYSYGRFMNYVQVDADEQNVLFRDNADYLQSRGLWHHHWENSGSIVAEAGQGIDGSYAFDSTVTAPSDKGWGELSFLGEIEDGSKRFWAGVVRLSALPNLDSHVELISMLNYPSWVGLTVFGVDRTATGVQWRLSAKSGVGVWSHTLFGEAEANTDYLIILSYETSSNNAKSKVWITKINEPILLEEASPSATLPTIVNAAFANMVFIGAADYPLGNVSPLSAFFDEMKWTEDYPATFGAWGSEETFSNFELELFAGWNMVSFPCMPDDSNFSSIFADVGFYQVLTWDGTSYVSPTVAEAGVGYWVLVLEETTVTIENAEPETSYTKSLSVGWSMIGSIYGETVNADDVFPGFYQLLTWDGTSYITSTTIEPGKGYWALVLEPTTITVGE